ncbi:MAG: putative quinol monooxygenase [Eubacteriales bacterium]
MIAVVVNIDVVPERVEEFIAITKYDRDNTRNEPGNITFELLSVDGSPSKFMLYEVYESKAALDVHKTQDYYFKWRDTVADMMASPRSAIICTVL